MKHNILGMKSSGTVKASSSGQKAIEVDWLAYLVIPIKMMNLILAVEMLALFLHFNLLNGPTCKGRIGQFRRYWYKEEKPQISD